MAFDGRLARLWTALPGIVQVFDPVRLTCSVQPTINGTAIQQDGSTQPIQMPMLLDCPVMFPQGGGVSLTFPIAAGDEVLVVFASRCIDAWWQQGGVQGQAEFRMHDLSDGFVIPGCRSQPRKFTASATAAQLRTDDGSAFIELNPVSKAINATTTGAITATAGGNVSANAGGNITASAGGNANVTASGSVAITAPTITLNGNVTIAGTLSQTGGGAANISGALAVVGDVTAGGKSLKTHTHSGVTVGVGTSGPPV